MTENDPIGAAFMIHDVDNHFFPKMYGVGALHFLIIRRKLRFETWFMLNLLKSKVLFQIPSGLVGCLNK